jgi:hypothetical protein
MAGLAGSGLLGIPISDTLFEIYNTIRGCFELTRAPSSPDGIYS